MAKLAYLFSTFPALSTTLTQHQVRGTERLGLTTLLAATRPPAPDGYHPEDAEFLARTAYLTPVRPLDYLAANLGQLARGPADYWRAVSLALRLNDRFPHQRLTNLAHVAGAARLARVMNGSEVAHVHVNFAFGAAGVAMFLKKMTGLDYSITIHGSDVLLPRPLTEEKLSRAKFVVSNCLFHVANLRRRYPVLVGQKFYVVRGGVDTRSGPWSKPGPPPGQGPLKILTVARLHPVKALDGLIRACGLLRDRGVDFVCRLVGDGPERAKLTELTARLDLTDRVKLTGAQYQDQVIDHYDWADVVALSSQSEGTPMTIIEAMAKARPVIAPAITALPEMVIHDRTGFLTEPDSAEDLAAKLAKLAGRPKLIARLGRAGRKRAEEMFDLEQNARRLMAVFAAEIPALGLEPGLEVDPV